MKEENDTAKIENLIILAMEYMYVAATIIDTQGTLLYSKNHFIFRGLSGYVTA